MLQFARLFQHRLDQRIRIFFLDVCFVHSECEWSWPFSTSFFFVEIRNICSLTILYILPSFYKICFIGYSMFSSDHFAFSECGILQASFHIQKFQLSLSYSRNKCPCKFPLFLTPFVCRMLCPWHSQFSFVESYLSWLRSLLLLCRSFSPFIHNLNYPGEKLYNVQWSMKTLSSPM